MLALDEEIAGIDLQIAARFREQRDAEVIVSMPGMGSLLGAEFITCTGKDLDAFGSTGRLAGVAGLAPVPRDSGRISGNMRRPHRYHRRLPRVFYLSAQIAARFCPTSKTFYDRKRNKGKSHKQAILALARRRLDVLWLSSGINGTGRPSRPSRLDKDDWESVSSFSVATDRVTGRCPTTHEAPVPLREVFDVSTHQRRSLVGSLYCRTRPAARPRRVGNHAHRHP
ncbi:transposase [Streptomyces fodineus]|uniref:transposase n=1 Tax=Streptomyces fodineus TaxID=1904616 RepID=UPI00131BF825